MKFSLIGYYSSTVIALLLSVRSLFITLFVIFSVVPAKLSGDSRAFKYHSSFYYKNKTNMVHAQGLWVEKYEAAIYSLLDRKVKLRAKKYLRPLLVMAYKYKINPHWLVSMAWSESHFRAYALSPFGAFGIMQLMPKTYEATKFKMENLAIQFESQKSSPKLSFYRYKDSRPLSEIRHDLENIEIGVFYLKTLINKFDDLKLATIAYNMGPSWTKKMLIQGRTLTDEKNTYLEKINRKYQKMIKGFSLEKTYVTQYK